MKCLDNNQGTYKYVTEIPTKYQGYSSENYSITLESDVNFLVGKLKISIYIEIPHFFIFICSSFHFSLSIASKNRVIVSLDMLSDISLFFIEPPDVYVYLSFNFLKVQPKFARFL